MGASYVHCLEGRDNVGPASYMLSYTWSYRFKDIQTTLQQFCSSHPLDPKRIYIWIDFLCINQHRVVQAKQQGGTGLMNFEHDFPKLIHRIGHILAMMSPWKKPVYLERIWCIFELFAGHQQKCDLTIVMPPSETAALEQDLFDCDQGSLHTLYNALSKTNIQKAKSSFESDRQMILGKIERDVGYTVLNNKVNELLRKWIRQEVDKIIQNQFCRPKEAEDTEMTAGRMIRIGNFLRDNGELEEALKWYQRALSVYTQQFGAFHPHTLNCHIQIGEVHRLQGDYDKAMEKQIKALAIHETVHGTTHPNTANSHYHIGQVLESQGNNSDALIQYGKSLAIRESCLGSDHPDTAWSHHSIGVVLHKLGDYTSALTSLSKAVNSWKRLGRKRHPDIATTYNCIGNTNRMLRDIDGAMWALRKARDIRESVFGTVHLDTATTYHDLGIVLRNKGDYDEALLKLNKALEIRKTLLGSEHKDIANSQFLIGTVLYQRGDYDDALVAYENAGSIMESVFDGSHPWVNQYRHNVRIARHKVAKYGRCNQDQE